MAEPARDDDLPTGAPLGCPDFAAIEADTERICRDLLRLDTSNYGDGSGPGERVAAEYVMALLTEAGYSPELYESEPRRASVLLRLPGADPARPGLALHGHLDVVPAVAADWRVAPFGAEVVDGELWGRGAVDMKDMDAMMLAALIDMRRSGWAPARPLAVALFADEEAGGRKGSHWVVDHHPGFFEGVTEAVSEVGGFSVDVAGRPLYLLQSAEKGLAWLTLLARGTAGHGSAVNHDNAVTALAGAVAAIGRHEWPISMTGTVRTLLAGVAELTGVPFDGEDPDQIDRLVAALGGAARFVGASLATRANPTGLTAGYKANVIPSEARATVDLRYMPGTWEEAHATLSELAGSGVEVIVEHHDVGLEAPYGTDLTDAMAAAIRAQDPDAAILPYLLSAGTDNKALSRLGVAGYGFVPLKLPAGLDFTGMFHGVDERIPLESLRFGACTLAQFLTIC